MADSAKQVFFLDNFALRQWDDPKYSGTRISYDKDQFVGKIHAFYSEGYPLIDGYAPFCKHLFVPNFVGARLGALEITDQNRKLLRSGYLKRRPEELAVLSRWFPEADVEVPKSKFLDIILYSREQLILEGQAIDAPRAGQQLPDAPWGIISVKAQDEGFETPMQPITMMRNALGREEGGSGVKLDKEQYNKSVKYWEKHAVVADGDEPTAG